MGATRPGGIHACLRPCVLTCAFGAAWVEQGSDPQPHSARKQNGPTRGPFDFLAERVGFEPTIGYKPMLVFKTSAFNRSATSPALVVRRRIVLAGP